MAEPAMQWSLFDDLDQPSLFDAPRVAGVEDSAPTPTGDDAAGQAQPERRITFLHTADWQLGMTRKYLSADAQHAYTAARLDAVTRIGAVAASTGARFVVVCGDVFEDHRVSARLITQTLDRLGEFTVPVYLLPGNHDPFDAAGVYRSEIFRTRCPANVTVLSTPGVVGVCDDAELVVAPWSHKAPLADLVGAQVDSLQPTDRLRVVVGHGATDALSPGSDPSLVAVGALEEALSTSLIDYVALGDRHSVTPVGGSGRIWYSGAQEVTNFDNVETEPGSVLEVTLTRGADGRTVDVTPHRVGQWAFTSIRHDITSAADVADFARRLSAIPDKSRVVLQVALVGTVSVVEHVELQRILDGAADSFAAVRRWDAHDDLVVVADADSVADFALRGYAAQAADELVERASAEDGTATAARGALALLARLAARTGGESR
ncbi:exonuclease SbcCD subunit D [Gordonia sp. TBRC 11910]|uniref:Exonuclease SbcCD subunit D n=1 Tax=Gordonia asplenii TaxID=2725283 RepID=A0A848KSE0_9ACTN|nr:metallophosphoesterase [Gordonia asplenii]NMO01182.1 exonuclease SbcCD subunit D [Gordonia asplenii]